MQNTLKRNFYDLSLQELEDTLREWKEPRFRTLQVWKGIYHNLWDSPSSFPNLPKSLAAKLEENFNFSNLTPRSELVSEDGETIKTLLELPDGQSVETVLMKYTKRRTLCISTQAGCALGCVFCATGQMGFRRNLSRGEIVEQVLYFARILQKEDEKITNVVFMGMGEPFLNYEESLSAIDRLNHPDGLNLGERRFTISTAGIIPAIRQFAEAGRQINLAISLHAANDKLRSSLMPVNQKYPLDDLLQACKYYLKLTNRRITFEWALIQDVNDLPQHASELAEMIKGMLCHVNVIALNPTHAYEGQPSPRQKAEAFCEVLEKNRIPCSIRLRRGIDIQAGCGQLASRA